MASKLQTVRTKERQGQCVFSTDADRTVELKNSGLVLTTKEKVRKAEVLNVLKCVKLNLTFASTNGDDKIFQNMFPDSEIAKNYHQAETKTKYTIQYGI